MRRLALFLTATIALFAIACGGDSKTPAATATSTPITYVFLANSPTPAPSATATPPPSPTAQPAQPTATPEPPPPPPTPTPEPPAPPAPAPQPAPPQPAPPAPNPQPAPQPPASSAASSASVTARLLKYESGPITVQAGASVTITLNNIDQLVAHDIGLDTDGPRSAKCTGPCVTSFTFKAPSPGSHKLTCSLHEDMTIPLIVR